MKTEFFQIENRSGKLKLNDGVYKETADKLIDEIDKLYGGKAVDAKMCIGDVVCAADDALESVEIEINSPGGSVLEGQRIYHAIRGMADRGVEVTTTVNGLAASMGSVILMAGDKRKMTKGSRIMIHEASTIAWGDARTMKKQAELLEGISREISEVYADRTGGDVNELRQLMYAETWMDAPKAQELGFIHEVIGGKKDQDAKAKFDNANKGMTGFFAKLFPGNEQAEQIDAQLHELESLRAELEAKAGLENQIKDLAEAKANADIEVANLKGQLDEIKASIADKDQEIETLKADAEISKEKISIQAAELLAQTGHPAPVAIEEQNGEGNKLEKNRKEFNAMTPSDRLAFVKNGGKIK